MEFAFGLYFEADINEILFWRNNRVCSELRPSKFKHSNHTKQIVFKNEIQSDRDIQEICIAPRMDIILAAYNKQELLKQYSIEELYFVNDDEFLDFILLTCGQIKMSIVSAMNQIIVKRKTETSNRLGMKRKSLVS